MTAPRISIVIPARNEGATLLHAVDSIITGRSVAFPLEVVIVDDASTDDRGSRMAARFHAPHHNVFVKVVRLPRWSGIPYARNIGASLATSPTLFITDANVLFPHGWDQFVFAAEGGARRVHCAAIADMESQFTGFGCTLQFPSLGVGWLPSPRVWGGYIPVAPCSATVISASLFRELGGYDTAMPLYGAAEPEFSVRAWLSGAEIVSMPGLVLRHRFRPAHRHAAFLARFEEQLTRNYIRFSMLYLEGRLLARVLQHYADTHPRCFSEALAGGTKPETWARRIGLQKVLRYTFDDYLRMFPGLPGAA